MFSAGDEREGDLEFKMAVVYRKSIFQLYLFAQYCAVIAATEILVIAPFMVQSGKRVRRKSTAQALEPSVMSRSFGDLRGVFGADKICKQWFYWSYTATTRSDKLVSRAAGHIAASLTSQVSPALNTGLHRRYGLRDLQQLGIQLEIKISNAGVFSSPESPRNRVRYAQRPKFSESKGHSSYRRLMRICNCCETHTRLAFNCNSKWTTQVC